jgi:murein DD-endopeptidase MepM/ murein hydrolase activator NlpD
MIMAQQSHVSIRRLIQESFDKALNDSEEVQVQRHLELCPDCRTYRAIHTQLKNESLFVRPKGAVPDDRMKQIVSQMSKRIGRKRKVFRLINMARYAAVGAITIGIGFFLTSWLGSHLRNWSIGPSEPVPLVLGSPMSEITPTSQERDVEWYIVQEEDDLFTIAERFGISPQTILWNNFDVLLDNPHYLRPGLRLKILPVNGIYYEWKEGDSLSEISDQFGVEPQAILEYAGNHLDPISLSGEDPRIAPGVWLMIPGGVRELSDMSPPVVRRDDPILAESYGPGFCAQAISDERAGTGEFIWPVESEAISGYGYSEIHKAVDLSGDLSDAVFASDGGIVVYSGWSDWGYGNLVIIDHGNGWQSSYAHLDAVEVRCGDYVPQGLVIGYVGQTGVTNAPNLHFELVRNGEKVNPLDHMTHPERVRTPRPLFGTIVPWSDVVYFQRGEEYVVDSADLAAPTERVSSLSMEEAAGMAGFRIKMPGALPAGFRVEEAWYDPDRQSLAVLYIGPIHYQAQTHALMYLRIEQQRVEFDDFVGRSAEVHETSVGGSYVEYVYGGWLGISRDDSHRQYQWDDRMVPVTTLRFKEDGFYMSISVTGSGSDSESLDLEDLVAIVESLR